MTDEATSTDRVTVRTKPGMSRCEFATRRRFRARDDIDVDEDLYYTAAMDSLHEVRSPEFLRNLKNRLVRWMNEHRKDWTPEVRFRELVMAERAVLVGTEAEESLRQLVKNMTLHEQMVKTSNFAKGDAGRRGIFAKSRVQMPKKD
jgi:hypothetical protein